MTEATITKRFFEDGTYYSQYNMASLIKSLLTSGYLPQFGDGLVVKATNPATMSVTVGTGMGVLEGYIVEVEGGVVTLTLENADPTNARIDRIVARLKPSASPRGITFAVLKGAPSATPIEPELTRTSSVWELPLASVAVRAGVAVISQIDITDERVTAYNNPSALSNASKVAYGGVKIGSGINVSNGVISAGSCPYPVLVRLYETDTGRAKLIDANAVQNNVKQMMDLMCQMQNQDDMRTVLYEVVFNMVSEYIQVRGKIQLLAKNIFTDETRVLTETSEYIGSGEHIDTGVIQLKFDETAYATFVRTSTRGSGSITSQTYNNTVYLGTPT